MCWCSPEVNTPCCGRVGCVPTWQNPAPTRRPTFLLRLQGEPGTHTIHSLRAILKRLLRTHGMKCIQCVEEKEHVSPARSNETSPTG